MSLLRSRLGVLFTGLALSALAHAQAPDFSQTQLDAAAQPSSPDVQALPSHWIGSGDVHKLRVDADDLTTRDQLRASDVVLRSYDYGSFHVYVVDGTKLGAEELALTGFDVRDEYDLMAFNGLVLNGRQPSDLLDSLASDLRLSSEGSPLPADAGLYVVQFDGPVMDTWLDELESTGVERIHHMPMNAYVVRAQPADVAGLSAYATGSTHVQHVGVYEPAFRIQESLRAWIASAPETPVPVTVQLVEHPGVRGSIANLAMLSTSMPSARLVQQYVNVDLTVRPGDLARIAASPSVFQIEPRGVLTRLDEAQGQIMAGNLSGNTPTGPGYLAWLASNGFDASQFSGFSVNVVDDATTLTGHPDVPNGRVAFGQNPTNQTSTHGGHGFLNAHIVAGFNSGTGSAFEDSNGYNYGLGIAPWAHVGATAIFGGTGSSPTSWESSAYNQGARISSNSWSFQTGTGAPIPDYDSNSQEYDGIVRDARSGTAGNQELMVLFAAGNSGSGSNTVSTPSTAKNILTVGASENVRQTGTDGCGIGNSGANSANDIISFSSRGPVNSSGGDGRWKPEIVAPGTHVEAGVPQSNYNGSSVCNQYWPSGQTLYGWSSGTSHSTPAVAGTSALVYQWFLNQGLGAPSPAMNKAFIVAMGEYMNGVGAGGTLPSNSQGMGLVNMSDAFVGNNRVLEDQTQVLGSTGATFTTSGNVADTGKPFRVVLSWTDAPGSTSGAPWVNDLDLEVTVGGTTYKGNVFSGATSTGGGSADIRNNTESVFLPAGTSGAFSVTVRASSIAGDGLPGNGDGTDQDFALLVTNAGTGGPVLPTANFSGTPTSGIAPLAVSFTDSSSPSVTSWSWNFGDGNTSTVENPSHTYASPGSYSVSLTVTDSVGSNTNTKTNYVVVSAPPVPGISDGSFEGQTAGGTPASPWSVDFGTGNVVNPAGGTSSDNGLPTDGTQWVEITGAGTNGATPPSNPGGATSPSSGGAGVSQSFSYAVGMSNFAFEAAFMRNEGANQATYNDWMSVDITDGSTWQNLYYADTFTATPSTSAKNGFPMTAVSAVSVDLLTLFPGSSPATSFTVTVLNGNGNDSVQPSVGYADNFRLFGSTPPPTADFTGTPLSGTAPVTVAFTDASSADATAWSWDFGDGTGSNAQNPAHIYTAGGSYTVSMTATGPGGSDTMTKPGYVTVTEPAPTAGFTASPTSGTAPLVVGFSDTSSGSVSSWSWTFGDGATSSSQNPSHTYTTAGTYTVSLTVTGPGGSDTTTQTNLVTVAEPAPTASFTGTPTSGTAPLAVSFSDTSGGNVTSWSWTFGDGATSTAQNPGHTYTSVGAYTVSLTVTGPGGSDTLTRTNYINVGDVAPTAGFSGTPLSGVAPLVVGFTDSSTGSVSTYSWSFGDGGSSSAQNPSHTYTSAGTYSVSLTVTGPGGSDTLTRSSYVVVTAPPVAPTAGFSATPTSGTTPLAVGFSDASTGDITSWSWTFGDGGTSTTSNPSHTYTAAGSYTVSLTVSGPAGSDTLTLTNLITVNDPPVGGKKYYMSFLSNLTVPGIGAVRDEDIVSYDPTTGLWALFFDGSDVGVSGTDINAFTIRDDGGILMSFNSSSISIAGLSGGPNGTTIEDSDVVLFTPTSTGASTSGSWSFYLDGSDLLLTTNGEDIDGLHENADGSLSISTLAGHKVSGLSGADEDVITVTLTSTGSTTAGTWVRTFDGSDVGFSTSSGEDLNAISFDVGELLFSTQGSYSASGAAGADEDVSRFAGTFWNATSGSASLVLDLSALGLPTGGDVDGLCYR